MKTYICRVVALLFALPCAAVAQSEEKTFKNGVPNESRADACEDAKTRAQAWLKENTDRSHSYYLMNQARRGWPAKSDGTSACDCSATDKRFTCVVDAKISAVK